MFGSSTRIFELTTATALSKTLEYAKSKYLIRYVFRPDLKQVSMILTPLHWILFASLILPMLTLLGIVWLWAWIRKFRKEREPVSEKLLRPAGESSRREIEKLDEKINESLIEAFFGP